MQINFTFHLMSYIYLTGWHFSARVQISHHFFLNGKKNAHQFYETTIVLGKITKITMITVISKTCDD